MPVEVWRQFMAFPQFTLGLASYSLLWNMSSAFAERAIEQDPRAADDPVEQPGTHEMLRHDADYFEALPEFHGFGDIETNSAGRDSVSIPQTMNECNSFVTARLEELGKAWEGNVPWLAHQCRYFRDIFLLPRLQREQALLSLEKHLMYRLMGIIVLLGGNGMHASLYFPTPERLVSDPNASKIPVEFLEDRNPRIRDHFQAREQWISTFQGN